MSGAGADSWAHLRKLTPARIALGRSGTGLPTEEVLKFALSHAQARDAVHAPLDVAALIAGLEAAGLAAVGVSSGAPDRATYLRRPDLGRVLSADARVALERDEHETADLAVMIGDGLSSAAIDHHALPFLNAFIPWVRAAGWQLAPVVVAAQARVALGDEVGALLRARAVLVMIGERPGLSSPDSLGIYLTLRPGPHCSDADRNCISNVRDQGLSYDLAAFKAAWLLQEAFRRGLTGVALKDDSDLLLSNGVPPQPLAAPDGKA